MTNRRDFIKKTGMGILASAIPKEILSAAGSFVVQQEPAKPATAYNWKPDAINQPIGVAQGIYPGRVAWAHAPGAAHWDGNWQSMESPWWLDENTDQQRVTTMVANVIMELSGKKEFSQAWKAIFEHHNQSVKKMKRGYQEGEIVAVKINMNSTNRPERTNNYTDVAPQTVYAVI